MGEGLALLPFHALGLPIRETRESRVQLLGQVGPLAEEMEVHFSIFAWKIPWTEEPSGLQSMGSQRVGHTEHTYTHTMGTSRVPGSVQVTWDSSHDEGRSVQFSSVA